MKEFNLCPRCAGRISEGYAIRRITEGMARDIVCDNCKRRTIGARYQVINRKQQRGCWGGKSEEDKHDSM